MVTDEKVDKALKLIEKGAGNYEYFFFKLQSPAWIEPLSRRGRFRHPPNAERIDNLIRFPRWPEGEYLLRMAPSAPDQVAAAIEPMCFESDNPLVHQLLIEIGSLLPPPLARTIAVNETGWVKKQPTLFTLYPEKAAALIVHLASNGEPDVALQLASVMLEVRAPRREHEAASTEDQVIWKSSPNRQGRIEPVWLQRFVAHITEPLLNAVPDRFLDVLARNVDRAVSIHCSNHRDDKDDYSTIWRPHLDSSSHYEVLDECISALTRAIKYLGAQDADNSERIMKSLAPYRWPIFDRLRAFTYLEAAHPNAAAMAAFVSDPGRYRRRSDNPEFVELLKKYATSFSSETMDVIFRTIDEGPDPESYRYYLEHRVQPQDVESERTGIIDRWRLGWLHPLAAALDQKHGAELQRLLEKYNPPQPRVHSSGVFAVGEHSPMDLASLKAMSVEEIVTYLTTWTPTGDSFPFEEPSRSGLGETLKAWVADDPQRASQNLDSFLAKDLHPTYITAIFDSFAAALKTSKTFNVYSVVQAVQWACKKNTSEEDVKTTPWPEATWNWVHMSGARFMTELLLQHEQLDLKRAPELLSAVTALCFVPSPTEKDEVEYKKEPNRDISLALNSPRPVGVEALILYGRWIKMATPEAEFTPAQLEPVFGLLEQKIDPTQDPSVAVREMFGMQFRTLAWLDLDWFVSIIPKMFSNKANRVLDRFAWNAFLRFGGPLLSTFGAMRGRYESAVRSLQKKESEVSDLNRILASHLLQYYAHGAMEIDDPLLVQFFDRASVALRSQAIGDIGWNLGHETATLPEGTQTRLMRLWESRMMALEHETKAQADELGTFGWWLASKKFPNEWAVEQAIRVLEKVRSLRPDFAVVEAFAQLAPQFPFEAVRVVHVLFAEDREGWAIHGWSQHLQGILVVALNDGDKARAEAERMVELLVSKGHRQYRELITKA